MIYTLDAISVKISGIFLLDIDKHLKFICIDKGTRIAKILLEKKNNMRVTGLSNYEVYRATVINRWC